MKKIIGFIIVLLLIPFFIFIITDIDKVPEYPVMETQVLDKPYDSQLYTGDFYYSLPNTITETYDELPTYVEYYENGTIYLEYYDINGILNLDDGLINYTIYNDKAYINYINASLSLIIKPTRIVSRNEDESEQMVYPLYGNIELTKLQNGVGDKWLQNGTIERNVGKLSNVEYVEYGILDEGTYTILLSFISNISNNEIKISLPLYDIVINQYTTTVLDDKIIISNDNEFIIIFSNDTYISNQNIPKETTLEIEGYIGSKFNNIVLAFFWVIPILLIGGLFYLIFSRKE